MAVNRQNRFVLVLGLVLVLGGIAHSVGVVRLYVLKGLPDLNRVLLDVWIAEAQMAAGALFLIGRSKPGPRPWLIGATLILWTYGVPFLPVLIHRAPPIFWVMPVVYLSASLIAVLGAGERGRAI
jgi:hypothetical protein